MGLTHSPTATESLAIELLERSPILGNSYFRSLKDGSMPKERFIESQVQFFFAVGFFSRHLGALIARLPSSAERGVLVHNLSEEHGLDEENPVEGFRPHLAHDKTFAAFLRSLGVTADQLSLSAPGPVVRAFNLSVSGACSMETPTFAFAALGMIEYAFADISALIGTKVVELGWVRSDELVHYCLHAAIDKRHAAELFEAAERADKASIVGGLEFGRYVFDRLYRDFVAGKS
jgi:pyrroloquinoline-quinone synthase